MTAKFTHNRKESTAIVAKDNLSYGWITTFDYRLSTIEHRLAAIEIMVRKIIKFVPIENADFEPECLPKK